MGEGEVGRCSGGMEDRSKVLVGGVSGGNRWYVGVLSNYEYFRLVSMGRDD